jgi:AraC family transcriptional regulator
LVRAANFDEQEGSSAMSTHAQVVTEADRKAGGRGPAGPVGLAFWQRLAIVAYIEEHIAERMRLRVLGNFVCLGSSHFCRAFKHSFGLTPRRYLVNRRIELAKLLLVNPTHSVTEVGLALGFAKVSSFSTAFRHTTGSTPTEYRRALG